jgi:dGTPase
MDKKNLIHCPETASLANALSPLACRFSRGRLYPADRIDDFDEAALQLGQIAGDPFRADMFRILQSYVFKTSTDKTQVFDGHAYERRLINRQKHAFEVAFLASEACRFLGLNENLAIAIALGHDVGYPPLGSIGVETISRAAGRKFHHAIMSATALQAIERQGAGWNLSYEVPHGIEHHSFGKKQLDFPATLSQEARIVAIADKFAFVFSDPQDALTVGYFKDHQELPDEFFFFGSSKLERWRSCLRALAQESAEKGEVSFSESIEAERFNRLREWAYDDFYAVYDHKDRREGIKVEMAAAFAFFQEALAESGHNPFLAFALLSDSEAWKLARFARLGVTPLERRVSGFLGLHDLKSIPPAFQPDPFESLVVPERFIKWE